MAARLTPLPPRLVDVPAYSPPRWLENGHVQTMLGSVARRALTPGRERAYLDAATREDIRTPDGTVMRVSLNAHTAPAPLRSPLVVLIHGWLGCNESAYVLSAGAALWRAGYATARLNLRDHGETAHLNEEMYHSARIREVVDLIELLMRRNDGYGTAVIGYSLGGNFALRVARETALPALAVGPAIDPAHTMHQIDHGAGSTIYRRYFLRKWQRAMADKAAAFPQRYDFSRAWPLRSVGALTDYFVRYHSGFQDTRCYFDAYDLTGNALSGVDATILIAADDPIIPAATFRQLPASLEIVETRTGGHNAFLKDSSLASWCDDFVLGWCDRAFNKPVDADKPVNAKPHAAPAMAPAPAGAVPTPAPPVLPA